MNTSSFILKKLIRPHLFNLKPYSTARDEFAGVAEIYLDANENPFPTAYHRYPDPHQLQLKTKISKLKGIPEDCICLGNGSDEIIDLLIRLCCEPHRHTVLTMNPTYGMYEVSAQINGIPVIKCPLTATFELQSNTVLQLVDDSVRIIFLCSPNNPSGNLLNKDEVRKILSGFDGLVVIDEAYIDFSDDEGFLPEISQWPNLVVIQTLSKAWGMAGLRIGLAFAHPEIIHWLAKIKPPYNIGSAAQTYALSKLNNIEEFRHQVAIIRSERVRLTETLKRLSIVQHIFHSDANFLLVQFTDSRAVYHYLLQNKIIVRDRSTVLHGENCLRITVGTPEENDRLLNTLQQYCQNTIA